MNTDGPVDRELDPRLARLAERLREPVPLSDRVERTVLARLRAESAAPTAARSWRAWALPAMAAGLAAAFGLGLLVGRGPGVSAGRTARPVEFAFRTVADSAVAVVGDFNDWNPRATPLRHAPDGKWTVTVPLRPGRYRYTFIVDGTRWRRDPGAPPALEDDFGTPTSVITVARR